MYDKFKYIWEDDAFFFGLLMVLISVSSFGLGRLSVVSEAPNAQKQEITMTQQASLPNTAKKADISAEKAAAPQEGADPAISGTKQYVSSKNGTKYHLLHCPGAKQIKEENKIYFASKEEAEKAGYTPASNCKGI